MAKEVLHKTMVSTIGLVWSVRSVENLENMNQDRTHICSDKVPTVFDILLGSSITNYVCPAHFCDRSSYILDLFKLISCPSQL